MTTSAHEKTRKPFSAKDLRASISQRRWSELNRRWRICKQASNGEIPDENCDCERCAAPGAALDPSLVEIVAAWQDLPAAFKAGILAMVSASLKGGTR